MLQQQCNREIVMRHLLVLSLVAGISFVFTAPAAGAIVNGDFEAAGSWYHYGSGGEPCDKPFRATPGNTNEGGVWVGFMGDWPLTADPGCRWNYIYQEFGCDGSVEDDCMVQFDVVFTQMSDTDSANVYMWDHTAQTWKIWVIPPGWTDEATIIDDRGCGTKTIYFTIWGDADGTESSVIIDNVESSCVTELPPIVLAECTDCDLMWVDDIPDVPETLPDGTFTSGACCLPDVCIEVPEAECEFIGGDWCGLGTSCDDGYCSQGICIPNVTAWGLAVMVLLVLAAGTVVIRRRRAAVA